MIKGNEVVNKSACAPVGMTDALRQERERFGALVRLQKEVAQADLSLECVMALVIQCAMDVTGAEGATVNKRDGEDAVFLAGCGLAAHSVGFRIPLHTPIVRDAMQSGKTQYCADARVDTRINPEACRRLGVRSVLLAPLRDDTGVVGLLGLLSPAPNAFSARDVETAELLAGLVAAAMSRAAAAGAKQALLEAQAARLAEREEALVRLSESQNLYMTAIDAMQEGYVVQDAAGTVLLCNRRAERILGVPRSELSGQNAMREGWRFVYEGGADFPRDLHPTRMAIRTGEPQVEVVMGLVRAGEPVLWLSMSAAPLFSGGAGRPYAAVLTLRDITEIKRQGNALQESEQRLRLALESGGLGTWDLDPTTGRYLHLSSTWKAHLGLPPDAECSRAEFFQAIHPDDRSKVREAVQKALEEHHEYHTDFRCLWPDGSIHWISAHGNPILNETGQAVRVIGVTQEITGQKMLEAERETALREAQERANRDPLTGLLNHRSFHLQFEQEAARAQRDGTTMAVLMMDLDNFKFFNDVYGHVAGDQVLCMVADKLRAVCRPYDVLARFGGDEFALLLPNVGQISGVEIEARLADGLDGVFYRTAEQETAIPLTISLGAALFPQDNADRHEVLRQADERLYWLKTGGTGEAQAHHVRALARDHVQGFSMLDALVTAVDNKDRYTRRHSEDVMSYCLMIARELGLDEATQNTIAVSALLHDVGKIGVPDSVLRKPALLTEEEFEAIKQHPMIGAVIVAAVPGLEDTLDAVRHHHERWDGGGYPFGLRGEETPLLARLMAVADAFSAMTTDRPYRKGMAAEQALAILEDGAGTQWDPLCVEAFLNAGKSAAPAHARCFQSSN